MSHRISNEITIAAPTAPEIELAGDSYKRLLRRNLGGPFSAHIKIGEGDDATEVNIPASVLRIMMHSLAEISRGNAVALIPTDALLSTKQAADLLNVSVPYFDSLLDRGDIPFKTAAKTRLVRFDDLMAYKRTDDERRGKLLDELTAEAQELGLGY